MNQIKIQVRDLAAAQLIISLLRGVIGRDYVTAERKETFIYRGEDSKSDKYIKESYIFTIHDEPQRFVGLVDSGCSEEPTDDCCEVIP